VGKKGGGIIFTKVKSSTLTFSIFFKKEKGEGGERFIEFTAPQGEKKVKLRRAISTILREKKRKGGKKGGGVIGLVPGLEGEKTGRLLHPFFWRGEGEGKRGEAIKPS